MLLTSLNARFQFLYTLATTRSGRILKSSTNSIIATTTTTTTACINGSRLLISIGFSLIHIYSSRHHSLLSLFHISSHSFHFPTRLCRLSSVLSILLPTQHTVGDAICTRPIIRWILTTLQLWAETIHVIDEVASSTA